LADETDTVLVVNDTHVGSTVALWPPGHPIQDGGLYEPNIVQQWLWQQWQAMLAEVRALPKPPTLVLLGDLIQGGWPKDTQLVSPLPSIQAAAAQTLLQPLVDLCAPGPYLIRGTEWHEGAISDNVEMIARAMGGRKNPATSQYTWPGLYLDVQGCVIHFAHHIGVSSVPAYEATIPTRELLTMIGEMVRNWPGDSPNLKMIVRAHRHRGVHVQLPPDLHAMVVPAWQMSTAFADKRMPGLLPQVGYGLIEVRRGRIFADVRTFALPRPAVQRIGVES
jgi:hypothetical protein